MTLALTEALHVYETVAAELGIDPASVLAELADAIAEPLDLGEPLVWGGQ